MKPSVLVTRRIPQPGLDLLIGQCDLDVWDSDVPIPREVLLQRIADKDGLLCLLTDRIDDELLDAAPRLRVVSQVAVGVDNINVPACTRRGIPVGHTPGALTETTADLTWALLLAAARRLVEGVDYVRAGRWVTWDPNQFLGLDVYGATLGIVGFGRIGQAVARRAHGFNTRILYHSRQRKPDAEQALGASYVALDTLLAEADFVTLHVSLTPETYHLIGRDALRKMKGTAVLVNVARGGVVDPDALVEALRNGWIAYAALDVTEPEPLPADHPLLSLPNCIVVPHIGSASVATRTKMAIMAAENLLAGLAGQRLPHCVNPEVYSAATRSS
ncbi:MAG: D-glycerate dehydrogenase [Caldilineales bacterium]|nr:D-glycerate dehydrogenase [Caldilineales bacterium]MDW8317114.1 D-glycerate dehydrogenase [Anaerolineae bacterium]